jgi:hypothetical protein
MQRFAYRNFGNHFESMVVTINVEARSGQAGPRWYEIRRKDGKYNVYQESTFGPDDGVNHWMGSIAQDKFGNMALGYSVSNEVDVKPGIRYTGRLAEDRLNVMTLGEAYLAIGTGVQNNRTRWGDYSSMNVDPVDDCTFWYTNEYYTATGEYAGLLWRPGIFPGDRPIWQTRIGSFSLPGCLPGRDVKPKKSKGKGVRGKGKGKGNGEGKGAW